jgi:hypothetical protein
LNRGEGHARIRAVTARYKYLLSMNMPEGHARIRAVTARTSRATSANHSGFGFWPVRGCLAGSQSPFEEVACREFDSQPRPIVRRRRALFERGRIGKLQQYGADPGERQVAAVERPRNRCEPVGLRNHADWQAVTRREFVIEFARRTRGPMLPTTGVSRPMQQRNASHEEAVGAAMNALGTQSEHTHRGHVQHSALALISWNPVR